MALRIFEPCLDPSGASCTLFEDPDNIHLAEERWYPSSARIFDGSLVCGFVDCMPVFLIRCKVDRGRDPYSRCVL